MNTRLRIGYLLLCAFAGIAVFTLITLACLVLFSTWILPGMLIACLAGLGCCAVMARWGERWFLPEPDLDPVVTAPDHDSNPYETNLHWKFTSDPRYSDHPFNIYHIGYEAPHQDIWEP